MSWWTVRRLRSVFRWSLRRAVYGTVSFEVVVGRDIDKAVWRSEIFKGYYYQSEMDGGS